MREVISLQTTIFLLVWIGYVVKKRKIIGSQGQKNLTDLVIYVILPCNILKAFMAGQAGEHLKDYLVILGISIAIQIFCTFYGKIVYRKEAIGRRKCLEYGTICSNAGFLGNPIAEGVFGAEGLVLASFFLIPQRIMMWSAGLAVFTGSTDRKATAKKVLTHPCIIACVIGLILMLGKIKLPAGIDGAISALGNCNTAMSMVVIGMILAEIDWKQFWDPSVRRYAVHRLLVIPACVFAACYCLGVSRDVLGVSVLLTAMPAGATTSILAEKYGMESEFATKMVVVSTCISLLTICFWSTILK